MDLKMRFEFPANLFIPAQDLARALGIDFNSLLCVGLALVLEAHQKGILKNHMKIVRRPIELASGGANHGSNVREMRKPD
jgi:hypothetical protein